MPKTPYPIDPFPDPYRKPMPGDLTDSREMAADPPDTLHTAENLAPRHHQMPRLYHQVYPGMPYDMPDELGLLPGDMPMLYDLWGLWS